MIHFSLKPATKLVIRPFLMGELGKGYKLSDFRKTLERHDA
jgi:hypothetical protein